MCSEKGQWRGCSRRLEGLINLDSFSLIPVPWATMPHAPRLSSRCLLRTGCDAEDTALEFSLVMFDPTVPSFILYSLVKLVLKLL